MLDGAVAGADGSTGNEFAAPSSGAALVWRRFRRERLGVAALAGLVLIVASCFLGEPVLERVLGHDADTFFPRSVDVSLHAAPPWSWVPNETPLDTARGTDKTLLVLGADGPLGRDELLRLLSGGKL